MTVTSKDIPQLGELYLGPSWHVARKYLNGTDADTTGTFDIFDVKAGTYVREIRTRVKTAFAASCTITIGDSDDADGWMTAAMIADTTAVTTGLVKSSMTSDSDNAYGIARGKIYDTDQPIQAVVGAAAPGSGVLEVLIEYCTLED